MTSRNRFLKMCDKTSSPLDTTQAVLFRAHKPRQTGCVGFVRLGRVRTPTDSFAPHGAKQGALGFLAGHRFNHQSDSQRKTPDKRIALAEVH